MHLTTLDDVKKAQERIRGAAVVTPLLPCAWSDPERPLFLKPENLQPMGAFKIRGATNMIAALDPERRARGVVTHSSGNHAQAVAMAARRFGIPAAVVIPNNAPRAKIEATRALGAEIILVPPAEREARATAIMNERGYAMIPPYDAHEIIAGQGTVGLEILEQLPDVELVLVPCGGGGLLAGVATAIRSAAPDVRVVGVEPELAADAADSLRSGELRPWDNERRQRTIADGVRTALSPLTFEHIRSHVDAIITVTEDEIRQAVRLLAFQSHLVAEPSGALTTAAYQFHQKDLPAARRTVAVISGGNSDPAAYAALLTD